MAGKETNKQKPEEILVPEMEGQSREQGDSALEVPQPGLVESLYSLGAEVVLTITNAEKIAYTLQFPGGGEALNLSLSPGHYIICRIPNPLFKEPGLRPVVNPRKHDGAAINADTSTP